MKDQKRYKQIKILRDKRYTFEEIGKLYGISRQRVYSILYPKFIEKKEPTKIEIKNIKGVDIILGENITKLTGMKSSSRERVRELVRIRDNHTCQSCNKIWKEGERRFDVHHIDCDEKKTRKCDGINETDNMITLCHKCHLNIKEHRDKMKR